MQGATCRVLPPPLPQARGAAAALNQLLQCAARALTGRGRARWAAAQVAGTVLCLVAYLVGVAVFLSLTEPDEDRRQSDGSAPEEAAALLGLAHLPSLPLQLFFCLIFGNQVGLLWLLVRTLNRRLDAMTRGRAPPGASSHNALVPAVWPKGPFTLYPAASRAATRWANPSRTTQPGDPTPLRVGALCPAPGVAPSLHGEVREVHALHAEVRHALTLLTSAHGLELLLMVLVTFSAATTSLYIWRTDRDECSGMALAWSGLVALFLFGVLTAGELVKREVGQGYDMNGIGSGLSRCTMELTQRLLIYHEMSPELRWEMRRFSHQLLHQGLKVSAYGFLSLDYTMLQGMIGSVTTYLIMVIQLSPEDPAAAPAEDRGRGNATGSP
ncbi:Gustatory receptor 102 [Frankliniella occidentalis]|nr:Gustatory receptor 102 [Frankliniella occidentalis]